MDRFLRGGIAAVALIAAGLLLFRRRSVVPPSREGHWHPVDR